MYLLGGTSFINDFRVPSTTSATLLLSLLISLLLLLIVRLAFFAVGSLSTVLHLSEKQTTPQQTGDSVQQLHRRCLRDVLSSPFWSWRFDGLPLSLPISFSFSDHEVVAGVVGKGVDVSPSVPQAPPSPPSSPPPMMTTTNVQVKSAGPAFEHPLPAMYETEVPVSMAKMIMSRHTSRRPSPVRPPRRVTVASAPRRVQSMV